MKMSLITDFRAPAAHAGRLIWQTSCRLRFALPGRILLFFLFSIPRAQAGATLFLAEPYGYDATFAGTGHAAMYLNGVCATSPVVLRRCAPEETGIVISRYHNVAGYDWIAIPLIPYLYAVEEPEDIPLFADRKVVAFLRDRYRRKHLESLAPDLPDGGTPPGHWSELVGASYIRTIYTFEIETSPDQDEQLIRTFNERPNRPRWNLVTANCADFVREIISFYYPHSVHRSIIGDLGVTTPKQVARTLSKYLRHHPELQTSTFVIPQIPGTIPRSKRVRGVLEVPITSKKYVLPIFLLNPYLAGSMVAVYVGQWHFDPGKKAPILDAKRQLDAGLTRAERRAVKDQLNDVERAASSVDADQGKHQWTSVHAAAEPALDVCGRPTLKVRIGGEVMSVGIARSNILDFPAGSEFAAGLVKARLRIELKSTVSQKTARSDVEDDLVLLKQLVAPQQDGLAKNAGVAVTQRTLSAENDY